MAPWKSGTSHKSTHSTHRVNLCMLPSQTELVLRCICLNKLREMSEAVSPTAHDDSLLPLSAENNHTLGTKGLLMLSQSRKIHPENTCKWRKGKTDFVFCFPPLPPLFPRTMWAQQRLPAHCLPVLLLLEEPRGKFWHIDSLLSSHSSHVGTAGKSDVWTNPRES